MTREQFAFILYRYAALKGMDYEGDGGTQYDDAASASGWTVPALAWALENGLLEPTATGSAAPTDNVTDADLVSVIRYFYSN